MPTLDVYTTILGYADATTTNNPNMRFFDWKRQCRAIPVERPMSTQYSIAPGEKVEVFSGVKALNGPATGPYVVSQTAPSTYRLLRYGSSLFRVNREVALAGTVEVIIRSNVMTLAASEADAFDSVMVGDTLWLDEPFSPLNRGFWQVISNARQYIAARRFPGVDFEGTSETVPLTDSGPVVFSAAGVQVGEKVALGTGFSLISQRTFKIVAVTPDWIEFVCTDSIPTEAVDGTVAIYSSAKKYVRVEVDAEAVLQLNGDTSNSLVVSPIETGNPERPGWFEKYGPTYSLAIVNRSAGPLSATVISCE